MQTIPFFDDAIRVLPHTASSAERIGHPVTLREFAAGGPVALYRTYGGEYVAERRDARNPRTVLEFIEGPEAP